MTHAALSLGSPTETRNPGALTAQHPLGGVLEPLGVSGSPSGGKAEGLAVLQRFGLPVPAGVVVPNACFEEHCRRAEVPNVAGLAEGLDPRDHASASQRSAAFARALGATHLEPELLRALAQLGPGPWIVRSSALGEDSESASFAGLLVSRRVDCGAELAGAVLEVWTSLASVPALLYQAARGERLRGCGVVIQRYVEGQAAGVVFTRSPDPRHGGAPLLEYVWGPGQDLVDGSVTPGRYLLRAGSPPEQLRSAPGEAAAGLKALQRALGELAVAGWTLEEGLGVAQDLEWVLDRAGALHFVQARPITTSVAPAGAQLRWSNSNVNENYPDPLSPFLYSVAREGYEHYFRNLGRAFGVSPERLEAAAPALESIVGAHGGRLYYNLTSIHEVLRLLPKGEALAAAFNRFTGAEGVSEARPGAPRWGRGGAFGEGLLALRAGLRASWSLLRVPRGLRAFERRVDAFAARTRPALLAARSTGALRADLRSFLAIRFQGWTPAGLCDAAALLSYAATRFALQRAFGEGPESTRINDLLSGLKEVVSGHSVDALWDLGRAVRGDARLEGHLAAPDALQRLRDDPACAPFCDQLEAWLEDWGFRHSGELLLTRPSFQEEPEGLIPLIRAYAALDEEGPRVIQARQEAARRAGSAEAFASLTGARGRAWALGLRVLLRWARAAIGWRERARLKQALLYTRLRRVVLALGERLAEAGLLEGRQDAFFLTHQELDALAGGSALLPQAARQLVEVRRRELAALGRTAPPDAFELPEGVYRDDPEEQGREGGGSSAGRVTTRRWRGTPAAAGRVEGRAVVLSEVSQAGRLEPGDVLIVRQTDPGWAPVFFLLGGLVLERGGMLSHGAILAREYGIPTVVEVPQATAQIPDGARVRLDGSRGTVEVLAEDPADESAEDSVAAGSLEREVRK